MSRIFETAASTVTSLIGFAGLCWLLWQWLKRSDDPANLRFKLIVSLAVVIGEILFARLMIGDNVGKAFLLAGSFGVCGLVLSIVWASQISSFLVSLLTSGLDGGRIPPESKPYYSAAVAKRKSNKPLEAAAVVRERLAKFPDDFEGVMLLANIQAEDLKDLPSAEMTLNHFCECKQAPAKQVAVALGQLADWRLKFYQEVSAARVALERIVEKYPGTKAAAAACERIARLDGPEKASSVKAALQRLVDRYPGTELALAARERIAQLERAEKNLLPTRPGLPGY